MRISILLTCFTILISTFGSAQQIKRNLIANSCFEEGLKHCTQPVNPISTLITILIKIRRFLVLLLH